MTADQSRPVPRASAVDSIDRDALRTNVTASLAGFEIGALGFEETADRILALVRPVEGVTLTPEEAAFVAKGLRHSQWWVQPDVDRAYALASRLEARS